MNVYFYCSYNMSPTGYQQTSLDLADGIQHLAASGEDVIDAFLTHGGSLSGFGVDEGAYYFVMKGLRAVKPDVPSDEPGHTWYMNVGFSAEAAELSNLCAIIYHMYTDYQNFSCCLASGLSVAEQEMSYLIDVDNLREMLKESVERYNDYTVDKAIDFHSAPSGLSKKQMDVAYKLLLNQKISSPYEFVILEGTEGYFRKSMNISSGEKIRHAVNVYKATDSNVQAKDAGPQEKTARQRKIALAVVLGVVVLLSGILYYIITKFAD